MDLSSSSSLATASSTTLSFSSSSSSTSASQGLTLTNPPVPLSLLSDSDVQQTDTQSTPSLWASTHAETHSSPFSPDTEMQLSFSSSSSSSSTACVSSSSSSFGSSASSSSSSPSSASHSPIRRSGRQKFPSIRGLSPTPVTFEIEADILRQQLHDSKDKNDSEQQPLSASVDSMIHDSSSSASASSSSVAAASSSSSTSSPSASSSCASVSSLSSLDSGVLESIRCSCGVFATELYLLVNERFQRNVSRERVDSSCRKLSSFGEIKKVKGVFYALSDEEKIVWANERAHRRTNDTKKKKTRQEKPPNMDIDKEVTEMQPKMQAEKELREKESTRQEIHVNDNNGSKQPATTAAAASSSSSSTTTDSATARTTETIVIDSDSGTESEGDGHVDADAAAAADRTGSAKRTFKRIRRRTAGSDEPMHIDAQTAAPAKSTSASTASPAKSSRKRRPPVRQTAHSHPASVTHSANDERMDWQMDANETNDDGGDAKKENEANVAANSSKKQKRKAAPSKTTASSAESTDDESDEELPAAASSGAGRRLRQRILDGAEDLNISSKMVSANRFSKFLAMLGFKDSKRGRKSSVKRKRKTSKTKDKKTTKNIDEADDGQPDSEDNANEEKKESPKKSKKAQYMDDDIVDLWSNRRNSEDDDDDSHHENRSVESKESSSATQMHSSKSSSNKKSSRGLSNSSSAKKSAKKPPPIAVKVRTQEGWIRALEREKTKSKKKKVDSQSESEQSGQSKEQTQDRKDAIVLDEDNAEDEDDGDENAESEIEDEEYEVEALLKRRFNSQTLSYEFLVKWKGYPDSENNWESADSIHAADKMKRFYEHTEFEESVYDDYDAELPRRTHEHRIHEDGITLLEDMLTDKQVQLLRRAIDRRCEAVLRTIQKRNLQDIFQDRGWIDFKQRGNYRYDMQLTKENCPSIGFLWSNDLNQLPWMAITQRILGKTAVLKHAGCIISLSGAEAQQWHQDGPHVDPTTHLSAHALNVFIPLVDMNKRNGSTEFIPQTHVLFRFDNCKHPRWRPNVKAGQPLIFDYRLKHRGMINHTDETRPLLYLTYALPSFSDLYNFAPARYNELLGVPPIEVNVDEDEQLEKQRIEKFIDEHGLNWKSREARRMERAGRTQQHSAQSPHTADQTQMQDQNQEEHEEEEEETEDEAPEKGNDSNNVSAAGLFAEVHHERPLDEGKTQSEVQPTAAEKDVEATEADMNVDQDTNK